MNTGLSGSITTPLLSGLHKVTVRDTGEMWARPPQLRIRDPPGTGTLQCPTSLSAGFLRSQPASPRPQLPPGWLGMWTHIWRQLPTFQAVRTGCNHPLYCWTECCQGRQFWGRDLIQIQGETQALGEAGSTLSLILTWDMIVFGQWASNFSA